MDTLQVTEEIRNQINAVFIGKEEIVENVLITLLARGHILLEDVPGVGKTTLANALAKSIDCSFGRIQFTPDTLPGDITGISLYNMKTGSFEYTPGVILHNIILADEINRTSPKTQACLLEAMEENQVTVDGIIHPLDSPFMVIATQNPIDFLGTYHLPEAQLDRFLMRLSIGYPSHDAEKDMVAKHLSKSPLTTLSPVTGKDALLEIQSDVDQVFLHEDLVSYAIEITEATRTHEYLTLGASPRATLALLSASKARAFVKNRDFVIPDDIKHIAEPVLCHRFVLAMEAKIKKVTAEMILQEILRKIRVPVL